jgi:hypothetical protein
MGKAHGSSWTKRHLALALVSALAIASVAAVPPRALAATATLAPTDDSYVYEGSNAAKNYGSSTIMAVKTSAGSDRYAFLKFDLSSLSSVSSAKLRVYGSASAATTLNAYSTGDSWSESTLTWNNMPAIGSVINGVPINTTKTYYEIDVTSYVQAELAGDQNASFVLEETVGKYSTFNSKEASSNAPQLVVDGSSGGSGDTQAPTAPANLTASAVSSSQINVSWTAATDNVGVSGYNIYRGGSKIASTSSTSYSDTGLTASTTYSYTVKAYDAAGNVSGASNTASATTASSGGSGGLDPSVAPGGNFDLSIWRLQLPTGSSGSPTTIKASELEGPDGYQDIYFYTDTSDGAMTMMDPTTGVTTSGSKHPRTELREDTSGWSTAGTNILAAQAQVTEVPDHVCIGQIFQAPPYPSKPLLELMYYSNGTIKVMIEATNQGGDGVFHTLESVTPGSKFTYALSLTGTTITITINGTDHQFTLPSSFVGESFYFKAGDYDQTATSGTPGTEPGTVVKFYALDVTHS